MAGHGGFLNAHVQSIYAGQQASPGGSRAEPVRSRLSPPSGLSSQPAPALSEYPNTSPPEPSGPRYSARVALSCERGHAPGPVLHALQELRSVIDDRLRRELGSRYDRHNAVRSGPTS